MPKVSVLLGNTKTSDEAKYDANSPLVLSPLKIASGYSFLSLSRSGPLPTTSLVPSRSKSKNALIFFSIETLPTYK